MRKLTNALACLVAIALLQGGALAQSFVGYTISDNNTDDPPFNEQQFYSFNVNTGVGTLIVGLGGQGAPEGTAGIKREYEGLASVGGTTLYGVSQPLAGTICNNNNDPILGLNSDVRIFRVNATYPLPNGVQNAIGPQIGETCADFGEESSAAYDPVTGFIWAVFSDDLLPATAPRSRLYRISPTTGQATQIGPPAGMIEVISTAGDDFPYVDGLAILPNGQAFASDARFTNNAVQDPDNTAGAFDNGGLYRIFLSGGNAGNAQFIKHLFRTDINRDTGAANIGLTVYVLIENGLVFNTLTDATAPTNGPVTLSLPGCLGNGSFCGDLEGFDIPQPGLR